jgi:hypothetical protein
LVYVACCILQPHVAVPALLCVECGALHAAHCVRHAAWWSWLLHVSILADLVAACGMLCASGSLCLMHASSQPRSPLLQVACRRLHGTCCRLHAAGCVSRVAGCVSRVAGCMSPLHFVGCILRLASCLLHNAVARCVLEHTVTIMVFLCLLFQGRMLNVSCSAKPDGACCTVRVACDGACCMLRVSCMQRATRSMQQNGMPACPRACMLHSVRVL